MQPLDSTVHYGETDRSFLEVTVTQMELLPDKLHQLRWKLNQKAKNEPKFRFYALYDRIYRMDVLEAAWKHVGKTGKASGIDGVRVEDIISEDGRLEEFLETIHEELKSKSYHPSAVKRVYIAKSFRDLGHYCYRRMTTHLNRRSQRKYHRPKGLSNYQYLQNLGLYRP